VDLVDLIGAGRLAVGLGAVVLAGLAAGLLGLARRLALGEGGSLALAGTGRLIELAAEALVLGLQFADASLRWWRRRASAIRWPCKVMNL
jgi:hypothetical protein